LRWFAASHQFEHECAGQCTLVRASGHVAHERMSIATNSRAAAVSRDHSSITPSNIALCLTRAARRYSRTSMKKLRGLAIFSAQVSWPAPVIWLYLGQTTPEAVLATAGDPVAYKQKDQVCEANFFSGELALQQGSKDGATLSSELRLTAVRKISTNGPPPKPNSKRSPQFSDIRSQKIRRMPTSGPVAQMISPVTRQNRIRTAGRPAAAMALGRGSH